MKAEFLSDTYHDLIAGYFLATSGLVLSFPA